MNERDGDTTKFSDMAADDGAVEPLSPQELAGQAPDAGEMVLLDSADDLPAYRPEQDRTESPADPSANEDPGLNFADSAAPTARHGTGGQPRPRPPSGRIPPRGKTPGSGSRRPSSRGTPGRGSRRPSSRGTPGSGTRRPSRRMSGTSERGRPRTPGSQSRPSGSGQHVTRGAERARGTDRHRTSATESGRLRAHGASSIGSTTSAVGRARRERPERSEKAAQAALERLQARAQPAPPNDPWLGRDLGPFRVEAFLGSERGERRYLAQHEELKEWTHLRVYPFTGSYKDEFRRLADRGERAARVDHPNVDLALGSGRTKECFFVGTRPPLGPSLAEHMARGRSFSEAEVKEIVRQASDGLKALHAREMFHGHLSPHTIREESPGYYVLHEVGLARPQASYGFLSAGGDVLGWPGYIAPETVDAGGVSRTADIYALGCVAWTLLAKKPPFSGDDDVQILLDQLNREVPRLDAAGADVSPELATLIAKATGYTVDTRYKDTNELLADLRGVEQGEVVRPFVSDLAQSEETAKLSGAGNTLLIVLVLLNAAALALLVGFWIQANNVKLQDPVGAYEFPLEVAPAATPVESQ